MERSLWIEAAREAPLDEVAAALGLDVGRGGRFGPCPACGAERASKREGRRRPCGLRRDLRGWRCHRCGASGDAPDLVALRLRGARVRELAVLDDVREWFAALGRAPAAVPVPRRTVAPPPPAYPPAGELAALWSASRPLGQRPDGPLDAVELATGDFLRRRDFWPPDLVGELGGVRELPLPRAYPWPRWWPRTWASTWRLALRAWTPDGRLASLHARAVTPDARPKTRWPLGYEARGLLLADWAGELLLRADPGLLAEVEGVVVVEGVTDLLRATLALARDRCPLAVLGAASGGFAALGRVALPERLTVYVATDPDDAGDRYARQVVEALAPRPVRRLPLARGGRHAA